MYDVSNSGAIDFMNWPRRELPDYMDVPLEKSWNIPRDLHRLTFKDTPYEIAKQDNENALKVWQHLFLNKRFSPQGRNPGLGLVILSDDLYWSEFLTAAFVQDTFRNRLIMGICHPVRSSWLTRWYTPRDLVFLSDDAVLEKNHALLATRLAVFSAADLDYHRVARLNTALRLRREVGRPSLVYGTPAQLDDRVDIPSSWVVYTEASSTDVG